MITFKSKNGRTYWLNPSLIAYVEEGTAVVSGEKKRCLTLVSSGCEALIFYEGQTNIDALLKLVIESVDGKLR
jgi:hypothetical protein